MIGTDVRGRREKRRDRERGECVGIDRFVEDLWSLSSILNSIGGEEEIRDWKREEEEGVGREKCSLAER